MDFIWWAALRLKKDLFSPNKYSKDEYEPNNGHYKT